MDLLNIRRTPTSKGMRSVLTYWYRGHRYRPVLGYSLKPEQEREAALQVIAAIHANTAGKAVTSTSTDAGQGHSTTFEQFIPTYLQYLKAKRPRNDGRNETILTKHLRPFFGHTRLSSIKLEDGLEPISKLKKQYCDEALSGQVHLVDRKIPKEMMVSRSLTSVRVIGILACNRF